MISPQTWPERHTYRRFYIAAAAGWVRFAEIARRQGQPAYAARALAEAARRRRIAAVYPRNLGFRT